MNMASLRLFSAVFCAFTQVLFPALASAQAANAISSGDWDSDIWAGGDMSVLPGLRPLANGNALIRAGVVVTVSSQPLEEGSFTTVHLTGEKSGLTLESGAVLSTEILNNAGGNSVVTVMEGAVLNIGIDGLRVGHGNGSSMRVEGGVVSVEGEVFSVAGGREVTGLLEVSGGVMSYSGAVLAIAANVNTDGTLQVNGGEFSARQILFTQGRNSRGTLELQSGTLNAESFDSGTSPENAIFEWTGGTLVLSQSNMDIVNMGTGDFAIGGVDTVGTFVVSDEASIAYTQGEKASLTIDFAGDKSFDTVAIGGGASFEVTLSGVLNLNFLEGYTPSRGTSFDIITANKIVNNGVKLEGNGASRVAPQIVNVGGKDILRLTAASR